MNTRELKRQELIDLTKQHDAYQTIEDKDETIVQGWRDCEGRWDKIKPFIKANQCIMDIGSHYGYFTKKANDQGCIVWSIEENEIRARIQRKMLELNGCQGVYLTTTHLDTDHFVELARVTECIDAIFALSVLHYLTPLEYKNIIYILSLISPNVFIELPNPNEVVVDGNRETINLDHDRIFDIYFDTFQKIGEFAAPNGTCKRTLYHLQNKNIHRNRALGYMHGEGGKFHDIKCINSIWKIDDKSIQHTGFNLNNLFLWNLVYPSVPKMLEIATQGYYYMVQQLKGELTDMSIRNVIAGKGGEQGVDIIDFTESIDKFKEDGTWQNYVSNMNNKTLDDIREYLIVPYEKEKSKL
jgi:hypothetical protein